MDLGVEQVAHQENAALRDVEGDVAGGMRAAFLGELEGEPAEAQRHRAFEGDVGQHQLGILVGRILRPG